MKKTFYHHLFILILSCVLIMPSCKEQNNSQGQLLSFSDCKTFNIPIPGDQVFSIDASQECIKYQYHPDNQSLDLTHVNAGFNCCPGEITADISISGNAITIIEKEKKAGCHCNCLFDLHYQLKNLSSDIYQIEIISPYQPAAGPALKGTIELNDGQEKTICVTRNIYPWGIDQ